MKIGRIEIKTSKLEKPDFGVFLNERKANLANIQLVSVRL